MENKNTVVDIKVPPVDSHNVLNAALEPNASDHYKSIKIIGLTTKKISGTDFPMFVLQIGEGEKVKIEKLAAVPEEIIRYKEELAKSEKTS